MLKRAFFTYLLITLAFWASCSSTILCARATWSIFSKALTLPMKDFWDGSSGLLSGGSWSLRGGLSAWPLEARDMKEGFRAVTGGGSLEGESLVRRGS